MSGQTTPTMATTITAPIFSAELRVESTTDVVFRIKKARNIDACALARRIAH